MNTVKPELRGEERRAFTLLVDRMESVQRNLDRSSVSLPPPILEREFATTVQVPLFDFSAPPFDGCSMSVQTSTSQSTSGTWKVSLGANASTTKKVLISFKATFIAGPGESKRVFVPMPAGAIRQYYTPPSWREGDSFPSSASFDPAGLKPVSDSFDKVSLQPAKAELAPAVRSIPATVPEGGRVLGRYLLGQDTTRGLAEYEYTQETTTENSVGASGELHGVTLSASVGVALTKRLTLKILLAAGRDYRLKAMPGQPGVYWEY